MSSTINNNNFRFSLMFKKSILLFILSIAFGNLNAQTVIEYDVTVDTSKLNGKSDVVVTTILPRNRMSGANFTAEISEIGEFRAKVFYHINNCKLELDSIVFKDKGILPAQEKLVVDFMKNWLANA